MENKIIRTSLKSTVPSVGPFELASACPWWLILSNRFNCILITAFSGSAISKVGESMKGKKKRKESVWKLWTTSTKQVGIYLALSDKYQPLWWDPLSLFNRTSAFGILRPPFNNTFKAESQGELFLGEGQSISNVNRYRVGTFQCSKDVFTFSSAWA